MAPHASLVHNALLKVVAVAGSCQCGGGCDACRWNHAAFYTNGLHVLDVLAREKYHLREAADLRHHFEHARRCAMVEDWAGCRRAHRHVTLVVWSITGETVPIVVPVHYNNNSPPHPPPSPRRPTMQRYVPLPPTPTCRMQRYVPLSPTTMVPVPMSPHCYVPPSPFLPPPLSPPLFSPR